MVGVDRKLQTVIESIIEQRANANSDVFIYDFSIVQKKLAETQNFNKYNITPVKQRELLEKLDSEEYIYINYVDKDTCEWVHDYRHIIAEYIAPEFNPLAHMGEVFIYLPMTNVEALKAKYDLSSRLTMLELNYGQFTVSCDGEKYKLPSLKSGTPTKILEYAWEHHDSNITRSELVQNDVIKTRTQESLKKIFKGNNLIKNILSPFVEMTTDSILIRSSANIKNSELQAVIDYTLGQKKG